MSDPPYYKNPVLSPSVLRDLEYTLIEGPGRNDPSGWNFGFVRDICASHRALSAQLAERDAQIARLEERALILTPYLHAHQDVPWVQHCLERLEHGNAPDEGKIERQVTV